MISGKAIRSNDHLVFKPDTTVTGFRLLGVSGPLLLTIRLSRRRTACGLGFTLLELMAVIAILATLAGIAIPVYSNQIEKAKITKAIAEIRMLEKEIKTYQLEHAPQPSVATPKSGKGNKSEEKVTNGLPDTLAEIGCGDLADPWGNPYQFANHANIAPGKRRKYKSTVPLNTDYDLYSMGPDGKTAAPITAKAGYDDIIRANDGGYVGPASQY